MEFWTIIKHTLYWASLLGSLDLLFIIYERQRKRMAQRPIADADFIMSNNLPCCPTTISESNLKKCINPHCKAKLSHKIINHIDSAKTILCVAMYMNTVDNITNAILRAHRRGVIVRIITDYSMIATTNSKINLLQNAGVDVRVVGDGEKYMHNKFCLIDVTHNEKYSELNQHPTGGLLINGSLNWTGGAFNKNWENVMFISDDAIKNKYKIAFDHIWQRQGPRAAAIQPL